MTEKQLALCAFPLRRQPKPDSGRGYVLACYPVDGTLASLMNSGLNQPPIRSAVGIMVWEGHVYLDGDEVPPAAKLSGHERDGILWNGLWRAPRANEWEAVRRGRSPWG